jgi:hypothetical protein
VLPELMAVIQVTSLDAVPVAQSVPAVTVKLPLPPPAATEAKLDDSEYEHATLAPACVTVNVCLFTVMWPMRELVLVLACTE